MAANPYESPENPSDLSRQAAGWSKFVVRALVIVGVLGLSVTLLLPSVRVAREPARRMQCSNNLTKQIGLGSRIMNRFITACRRLIRLMRRASRCIAGGR